MGKIKRWLSVKLITSLLEPQAWFSEQTSSVTSNSSLTTLTLPTPSHSRPILRCPMVLESENQVPSLLSPPPPSLLPPLCCSESELSDYLQMLENYFVFFST